MRTRERRELVVHLVTHAALHVPRSVVADVRREAHLFAVFILPSGGKLDLDYLDLLEGHAVVDHATLTQKSERAAAATTHRRRRVARVDPAAGVARVIHSP